ncbi:hypothetical protein ACLBOM_08605 [Escherichia coli]
MWQTKLLNDKSQVVAGGLLDMQAGDVENRRVSAESAMLLIKGHPHIITG